MALIIRPATLDDLPGIQNIHRNCDDPWRDPAECRAWVEKRLERGFYIQIAEYDGKIAGHGEWIVSDEPGRKALYLGMLQIDADFQRRGIGRAMIADGENYANLNGCPYIATIPDSDDHSAVFYRKCDFIWSQNILRCVLPAKSLSYVHLNSYPRLESIPFGTVAEIPFVFGCVQTSSRHMWECHNARPVTDDRNAPAFRVGKDYVQFGWFGSTDTALVLCWADPDPENIAGLMEIISALGHSLGLSKLEFVFTQDREHFFKDVYCEICDVEFVKEVL
jgi:GNAT superfamily N-acetyltransferase